MYEYCRVKVRLEWMREIEHILYTTPVTRTGLSHTVNGCILHCQSWKFHGRNKNQSRFDKGRNEPILSVTQHLPLQQLRLQHQL